MAREGKASEDKSFADLVAEAPAAPSEGVVSLVGMIAKSSEEGKFVFILQEGRTVTLEIAAVKGHAVLGSSLGRTVVRIEIEAGKAQAVAPPPLPITGFPDVGTRTGVADIPKLPLTDANSGIGDNTYLEGATGILDPSNTGMLDPGGGTGIVDPGTTLDPTDPTETGLSDNTGLNDLKGILTDAGDTYAGGLSPDTGWYQDDPLGPFASQRFGEHVQAGAIAPFVLATPHQAPANVVAALQSHGGHPQHPYWAARGFGGRPPAGIAPVAHLKGLPVLDGKSPLHDPAKAVLDASKPARDQAKGGMDKPISDATTEYWFDVGTSYWGDVTAGPADVW